jgi:hypothetical protein
MQELLAPFGSTVDQQLASIAESLFKGVVKISGNPIRRVNWK